ncbi:MAG: AEC family transporter [Alphaproteobacteria bacterium]
MDIIVTSVVPLFSVIFIGFGAGKFRFIDEAGVRALVTFVFSFAMPALIFRLMATTNLMEVDGWPVVLAYVSAQLPLFLAGLAVGGWLLRQSLADMTIQAFGSSFSNSVVLGLPLVLSLYGEAAGVPALLIITLDIAIFSVIILLLEIASLGDGPRRAPGAAAVLRKLALSVGRNPLILASVFGILVGLSAPTFPIALDKTLTFLGQAGPPAGLFALGATLGQRRLGGRVKPVAAMVSMKLLLHPLLAWVAVTHLFALDPVAAHVALLFAACPVGANVYVFAAHYRAAVETSATAILLSTAAALFSLSALALLLSENSS